MKRIQGSIWVKLCAVVVLLAAAFGAGVFGAETTLDLTDVTSNHWQDTSRYHNSLDARRRELIEGIELVLRIQKLEKQIETGEANPMAYADLEALQEQYEELEARFSRRETWFRFRIMDADSRNVLGTNLLSNEAISKAVRQVGYQTLELRINGLEEIYFSYEEDYELDTSLQDGNVEDELSKPVRLTLEYGVPAEVRSSVRDEFYTAQSAYEENLASFDQNLTGFLNLLALSLLALIVILWTAGHKAGTEGIVTTWQERIFFDLYAAAMIGLGIILVFCAVSVVDEIYHRSSNVFYTEYYDYQTYLTLANAGIGTICASFAVAGTLLLRTFAVRIKARCLLQTTLLCRVVKWMARAIHDFLCFLPITWKMVLGFGGYVIVSQWLFNLGRYEGGFMLIYFCLQLALLLFLAWWAYSYHRLRQGTKTIAKGDLEYQIDTRHMPYDLRLQAEDLNNISGGLATAVDEKMKSERFKAELITNVSHDLKTPLTSIINYVNLLKNTDQTDPKAVEYIEVLDRKSQRLKKLTEDLVEASKASTGVLSVVREKIGMSQLIDQALGEWEEKLTGRKLTLVTTLPEGETWVYADGRHLWRVIDNLLSNCAKYAMEGTRIYLDLERGKGQVSLSVKNISREPLNVPAERLMERFVRGEESRSTEGSGLGLSIARSLTELQGGTFDLAVDGDLFKAIVTLPQAN